MQNPNHYAHAPKRHRQPTHVRNANASSVTRVAALALTGLLAFGSAGVSAAALRLTGNITRVDADAVLASVERPVAEVPEDPAAGQPLNIVVLGSDERYGENLLLGGDLSAHIEGARSDTTMIMHISSDRNQVSGVSIPRDLIVDVPECPTTSGAVAPARNGVRFNAAFAYAADIGGDAESGAICTMLTLETMTNVPMDGFVTVDFVGFRNMVDALGGVEIYIPNDIHSPKANNLTLEAGLQRLDGYTALQYARARTGQGLGDGSDLNRIRRQQDLLGALAQEAMGKNLLTDMPILLQFLGATTSSLTMSSNFASIPGLAGLINSMRSVRPDNINFITVPYMLNPENPNVVLLTPEAQIVFDQLRGDQIDFSAFE